MFNLKRKLLKHNKLLAWFLILSMFFSLGAQVWSSEEEDDVDADNSDSAAGLEDDDEAEEEISYDLPRRNEDEVLAQMEKFAETDYLELFVLEEYAYTGKVNEYNDFYLRDEDGKLVFFEEGMFENIDNQIPMYDFEGKPVLNDEGNHRIEGLGFFRRVDFLVGGQSEGAYAALVEVVESGEVFVITSAESILEEGEDDGDDEKTFINFSRFESMLEMFADDDDFAELIELVERFGDEPVEVRAWEEDYVTLLAYPGMVTKDVDKVKEEGIFAVRVKSNGFVWWSNPVNAVHDPFAKAAQVNRLSSPIEFVAGNPDTYTPRIFRSNTQRRDDGPGNYSFVNACEKIEKIDNGARFHYHFPAGHKRLIMEVVLDGDSVLVTIPQDGLQESRITSESGSNLSGSVMLTLSVLNSFGAAPLGEDGYIVVADGSGAVIEFDNGKSNSAQYSGQVYGRDYSVSQKFAPPVIQQVYLPVYGIVRDSGENALVAIAEKGDENATIRAAVSRQGANATAFNLAWFDFRMRTTDSFYIGTKNEELTIYETGYIKTGDIAVRYYPLAGENLSYVDVADTYRDYLIEHKGVTARPDADSLPFFMTLNGGTIKTHSIFGFPFDLQTRATSYSQAQEIVEALNGAGVENLVIAYNDFNTPSIKREIATSMRYSRLLGGKSDFRDLMSTVSQNGYVMYPSMGFMEFQKSGGGYSALRHTPREVTRSRAAQQKYELAFGTPDPLQKVSSILSPFFFERAFDKIVASLKAEGVTTISLDRATSLLYSDFSRRNPFGSTYFNRRDTVQILTEGFKKLNDAGISIMAQSANAYALPYVSHISNIPLSSSNYDIFDYDVPFYQMVVRGLIPYTTKPFNGSSNLNAMTLLALSTGSSIHYEFMYESPGDFNDSRYNSKFFASYKGWADDSIIIYRMFKDLIGDITGERIVRHERVAVNEYETEFEGGKKIRINLNTYELKINGRSVDLSQYNRGGVIE
jgi:hypothetical protein